MSTDDANDDDGLKSLRAVWLSMPDEDPPERGLADLMAAARVKATEMSAAQPSWWERFVALMRRPQVLALATLVLLIGGGVIISQRHATLEAQPPASNAQPAIQQPAPGAEREMDKADTLEQGAAGSAIAAPSVEAPAPAEVTPAAEPARDELRAKGAAVSSPPKKLAPPPAKHTESVKTKPKASMSKAGGGMSAKDSPMMLDGDSSPESTTTTTSPTTRGASVEQLHEQARAAATNNDCAAVRTICKQIARKDAPYYRENIATDQALAGCLN